MAVATAVAIPGQWGFWVFVPLDLTLCTAMFVVNVAFGGLGGFHKNRGYDSTYESAPISTVR